MAWFVGDGGRGHRLGGRVVSSLELLSVDRGGLQIGLRFFRTPACGLCSKGLMGPYSLRNSFRAASNLTYPWCPLCCCCCCCQGMHAKLSSVWNKAAVPAVMLA